LIPKELERLSFMGQTSTSRTKSTQKTPFFMHTHADRARGHASMHSFNAHTQTSGHSSPNLFLQTTRISSLLNWMQFSWALGNVMMRMLKKGINAQQDDTWGMKFPLSPSSSERSATGIRTAASKRDDKRSPWIGTQEAKEKDEGSEAKRCWQQTKKGEAKQSAEEELQAKRQSFHGGSTELPSTGGTTVLSCEKSELRLRDPLLQVHMLRCPCSFTHIPDSTQDSRFHIPDSGF
jgi:hypothetical protein